MHNCWNSDHCTATAIIPEGPSTQYLRTLGPETLNLGYLDPLGVLPHSHQVVGPSIMGDFKELVRSGKQRPRGPMYQYDEDVWFLCEPVCLIMGW